MTTNPSPRQLLESSLVSFLKKLRAIFQECPAEHQRILAEQCLAEIRALVQDTSNVDQKRVLAILTEFFTAALGTTTLALGASHEGGQETP